MGSALSLFQIPGADTQGDVYHQLSGSGTPPIPEADENQGWIPQRQQLTQTVVLGNTKRFEEMDYARTQLEFSLVTVGDIF